MLWLVYLFSGFTAIGRLFDRERSATRRYLQWTVDPLGLILGKLFHAVLTTTALTAIGPRHVRPLPRLAGGKEGAGHPGCDGWSWLGGLSMTTTLVFVTAVASQVQAEVGPWAPSLDCPCCFPNSSWRPG